MKHSRIASSVTFLIALGATAIVVSACATPSQSSSSDARTAVQAALAKQSVQTQQSSTPKVSNQVPDWVSRYPTDQRYFIGVGSAPDTGNPTEDIATSQKNARNELASSIATDIKSSTTISSSQSGRDQAHQSARVQINEQVDLRLEGVQLVDSYHSKKLGYWYYYRLPKDALNPQSAIAIGVGELLASVEKPTTLSIGPVTYSDSGLSSDFSAYLRDQVLVSLQSDKKIRVSAKPLSPTLQTNKGSKTPTDRGLVVKAEEGTPATDAGLTALVLTGTFFGGTQGKVSVFLRLTDPENETIVGESSIMLDSSLLPPGLSVMPVNYATAVAAKDAVAQVGQAESSSLHVRIWPQRGDGATYSDGQDLVLEFSANQDCYIKMYHIDVNGRVSLILPNPYSRDNFFRANQTYQIPAAGAPYQFQLGKPYGTEFIKVIASTRQFRDTEAAFTDLGAATRSLITRGLVVSGTGPVETAQAMVSYTILGR